MTVDAYAHVSLTRYEPLPVLEQTMAEHRVSRAVLVQHLGNVDNSYIAQAVASRRERFAGVALLDATAASWRDDLEAIVEAGVLRGLRVTAVDLRTAPQLAYAARAAGLRLCVYLPPGQLGGSAEAVRDLGASGHTAPVVLTHLGGATGLEDLHHLERWAALPHTYVTLSGLQMTEPHPFPRMGPLARAALAMFGPRRVMWGSNFPVEGTGRYADELRWLVEQTDLAGPDDVALMTGGNAEHVWFTDDSGGEARD